MNLINSIHLLSRKLSLTATCLVVSLPLVGNTEPEALSEPDRIAVHEQLEKIQKRSDERVSGLYLRAVRDYRAAIQSDTATMELYLKCIEKVQFTDQHKKAAEFREWKKKNKETNGSGAYRMALRHQLSWLLLSIEAAQRDGDLSEMGTRAINHLDNIFENAQVLEPHRKALRQNAVRSVFARAYDLNIKVKDWPSSTLDIKGIYEKVVLPPLRTPQRVGALRRAWTNRVLHEGLVFEKWSDNETSKIGSKKALRSPEFEKFLTERRPALQWMMEVDCYKAGDEKTSALNMLNILEKHITHKDAPKWIRELQGFVEPTAPADIDITADTSAE